MKGKSDVIATWVVVVVALVVGGLMVEQRFFPRQGQPQPPPYERVESVNETFTATPEMRLFGNNRVTLVEFTDFECPYCKKHAEEMLPQIEKLPVTYLSVNYPLDRIHPQARKAARAAICASNTYDTHKMLFTAPLDTLEETACMKSAETSDILKAHVQLGTALGVQGTPTFFLGTSDGTKVTVTRRFRGGLPLSQLREEIHKLAPLEIAD